jgi:hypothetical protein
LKNQNFAKIIKNLRSTKSKSILLFYLEVDDIFYFLQISDYKLYLTKAKKEMFSNFEENETF